MTSIVNQTPYVRSSRDFPTEVVTLSQEVDKSYLDLANALNQRTIGIYATKNPSVTGNAFFVSGQKQQGLRQLYVVPAIAAGATGTIAITKYYSPYALISGAVTTSSDSRPIPYASVTANANIEVKVDSATLTIRISVGAASPAIVSGFVVLEWISPV